MHVRLAVSLLALIFCLWPAQLSLRASAAGTGDWFFVVVETHVHPKSVKADSDDPEERRWYISNARSERRLKEQFAIAGLARLSGGWPDFLEKSEQANEVYARIFSDINNRYVIGYYPNNKERDGKKHSVKIEVRGHPEYIVWGRKTYFAPVE